ncbi:MAG: class II aldolase/adducin family protein, partial [Novosphingobium sp.]
SIIDDMGDTDLMILRNHGLLVCGSSIAQAFANIFRLETACRIQVDALSGGVDNALELDKSHFQATRDLVPRHIIEASAQLQWRAVRRMLDRSGYAVDA